MHREHLQHLLIIGTCPEDEGWRQCFWVCNGSSLYERGTITALGANPLERMNKRVLVRRTGLRSWPAPVAA